MALFPPFLRLENSVRGVFLTVPDLVAIKTKLPSLYASTGTILVIRSPSLSWIKLTKGLPLATLPAEGIS